MGNNLVFWLHFPLNQCQVVISSLRGTWQTMEIAPCWGSFPSMHTPVLISVGKYIGRNCIDVIILSHCSINKRLQLPVKIASFKSLKWLQVWKKKPDYVLWRMHKFTGEILKMIKIYFLNLKKNPNRNI